MQSPLDNDSSAALLSMADFTWITYLGTNRICPAIKQALLANPYILQAFGNEASITSYKRDDFTITSLPAMVIYEPSAKTSSRFYSDVGQICIDIFLPIRLDREDSTSVLVTLGHAFKNILQSIPFWTILNDAMVPLPNPNADNYDDIVRYKEEFGSPLVEFGKQIDIVFPTRYKLSEIGDAWKLEIRTNYQFDMSNYYDMLQRIGVEGQVDPNKIIYNLFQYFSDYAYPKPYLFS